MDIVNQNFTDGFNRLDVFSKGLKSTVTSWEHGFFEFQNLFTNCSFGLYVRKYVLNNTERVSRVYSQVDLISVGRIISTFVSKRCATMKSLHYPNGNNRADGTNRNSNFIGREISILFHKLGDAYGTFCIDVTSKIRKIILSTQLSFFNRPNVGYMIDSSDNRVFSAFSKFFKYAYSLNGKLARKESNKNFTLSALLFHKGQNAMCNFKSFFSSNSPFILNSPINILRNTFSKVSPKILLKGNKNIFFSRNNRNGCLSTKISTFINSSSATKMAIAVDVTSKIGEIDNHEIYIRPSVDFKSTSNRNETPAGSQLSRTDFKAAISWYGDFVTISDQVQFVVQDRVLNEATKVLSLQLGLTIDTLIRDMMVSTASTIASTGGVNGSVPTEITDVTIQDAVMALRQGNARLMTNPLPGENKFGTAPVRASYWGFMSVDMQKDLENCASFLSVANYPNPVNALEAEWGSTKNIRWLMNTNGFSGGASTGTVRPIYSSFVLGQEAYGVVRLGAKEAEFIVKPLGASGTADPLNQRGTVGYKYPFATRILNDNWITRITSTLS